MVTLVYWPIFLVLCLVAGYGLWVGNKIINGSRSEDIILQDTLLRIPLALTFIFGATQILRTVWNWIDVDTVARSTLFRDPPGSDLMAAFNNGVLLSWAVVYVYFLWLRRKHST